MPVDQDDLDIADSPEDESAIESAFSNADEDELDDTLKPIYEFEWDDGSTRRTDDLEHEAGRIAVENLAYFGRQDADCTVRAVGFET